MKSIVLLIIFSLYTTFIFSQNKTEADKLVTAGVAFHDQGDYAGAIRNYDQALDIDKDNLLALAEKAYTLMALEKYEDCINFCQKAIDTHPGDSGLKTVYITYGNALDALKQPAKSLEVYNQGIQQYPDFYMLYFNKGVTLAGLKKYNQSIFCFQKAVLANPGHASSHNGIARLLNAQHKNIPALLAYARFLILEPRGDRAGENLAALQELLQSNVKKTGDRSIKITLDVDMPEDSTALKNPDNNFAGVELALALLSAFEGDKKVKKDTETKRFNRKFSTLCSLLKEQKEDNSGFYWAYYAPYFIEMYDKNLTETFGYIAFAYSDHADVAKWIKEHEVEIKEFYDWSDGYVWKHL